MKYLLYLRNTHLLFFLFSISSAIQAAENHNKSDGPVPVSIIIDDMGYNKRLGQQALSLPGEIAYSFLPETPYAQQLAKQAFAAGKRVLLHLPMQGSAPMHSHEPNTLTETMPKALFQQMLRQHLAAIPHISGVNNHMGSHLTPLQEPMGWLMSELADNKLFFVDSRTTHLTVTNKTATDNNVPFAERDVFLDNIRSEEAILEAFNHFIRYAKNRSGNRYGAVAIAHPYPETLKVLAQVLKREATDEFRLVDISYFLDQPIIEQKQQLVDIQKDSQIH